MATAILYCLSKLFQLGLASASKAYNLVNKIFDAAQPSGDAIMMKILSNIEYSVILGPSNSGKTCQFAERLENNKIFIVGCDIKDIIPLNNFKPGNFIAQLGKIINIKKCKKAVCLDGDVLRIINFNSSGVDFYNVPYNVCVDEIHFFNAHDLAVLGVILNFLNLNHSNIQFTMLPHSHTFNSLPNTRYLIDYATNLDVLKLPCHRCGRDTIHSSKVNHTNGAAEVIIGKCQFKATCRTCA